MPTNQIREFTEGRTEQENIAKTRRHSKNQTTGHQAGENKLKRVRIQATHIGGPENKM
jgi:hypothetical protein